MPKDNNVGHSDYTHEKGLIAKGIFRMTDKIFKGKDDLFYCDLTSGMGHIPTSNPPEMGCALRWLEILKERGPSHPFLNMVELVPENCELLARACWNFDPPMSEVGPRWHIYCGDYGDLFPLLVSKLPNQRNNGAIFIDPNGLLPRTDVLERMFRTIKLNGVDAILNLQANAIKRMAGAGYDVIGLRETLMCFHKRHWRIREPYGRDQWTFLIGTNWAGLPVWSQRGFHDLNSELGEGILFRLTHTVKEIQNYGIPELPGIFEPSKV